MYKLSISNIAWNTDQNEVVYTLMRKYGFSGLEIAPTKVIQNEPYSHIQEALNWAENLKKYWGFSVSSMQSIWYGRTEKLFGTEQERNILFEYTKSAIDFANAIECKNIVFGCPKNRNIFDDSDFDLCKEISIDFFKKLGDYAASKNTCIGMEANPKIYCTNFINTTEEAISFIKKVNSDGFKLNLDISTMIQNNESLEILQENSKFFNHVHISEPFLKKIEKRAMHSKIMTFLRNENYDGFISIEMGEQKNLNDVEDILRYVRNL